MLQTVADHRQAIGRGGAEAHPAIEAGRELWLGCSPTVPAQAPTADALTRTVLGALRSLKLGPVLRDRVVLTPACGLAGWPVREVTPLFRALATTAERMDDELAR